jgi:hypothetical protein
MNKILIYLHVPKCGGTTINSVLRSNFGESERFYVNPSNVSTSRQQLAGRSESERRSLKLLHGHLSYGWHELLPQDATYFTMIRDPVARVVSHYNYVRFRTDHSHYLRETVQKEDMSIAEYVTSGICDEMNNGMVRLLAGVEDIVQEPYGESDLPYGTNDPALLDRALNNLEDHFAAVGLQEQFDESLLLFRDRLGLQSISYQRKNTGGRHYDKVRPDTEDLEAIRSYNQLDRKLYQAVQNRFEEEISTLGLPSLQVRWLRLQNGMRQAMSESRRLTRRATQLLSFDA